MQEKFVEDLRRAFGEDLEVVELKPFTREEMQDFLNVLAGDVEIVPPEYLPIVHRLTGGRPIFLHLLADRMIVLGQERSTIMELFDEYADLVDVSEDDARLENAQEQVERRILDAIFNGSGEIGGYLTRIALMPKGVDAQILHIALGLPVGEATALLEQLEPLSFIKKFKAPAGGVRLHGEHLFLHDEVYRLLTLRKVIPYVRINERAVANTLVQNYYTPRIEELEHSMEARALRKDALTCGNNGKSCWWSVCTISWYPILALGMKSTNG